VSATGALVAGGLSGPGRAAGRAASVTARPGPRFDPAVARRLQKVLRTALRDPSVHAAGGNLHVRSPQLGRWTGVAGLGRVAPAAPMRPGDRFRAGSIMKPFVSVVVLQLVRGMNSGQSSDQRANRVVVHACHRRNVLGRRFFVG
jgi:D-alanyl-D-alanine carboxypeptidase